MGSKERASSISTTKSTFEENAIIVCVRARPLSDLEHRHSGGTCLRFLSDKCVEVYDRDVPARFNELSEEERGRLRLHAHTFSFDHAYDMHTSQAQVYEEVGKPLLTSSWAGFNTCIFAYGQTGSGKSYCMMGPDGGREVQHQQGIVPRLCEDLFNEVRERTIRSQEDIAAAKASGLVESALPPELEVHVFMSYLEIYQERARCLLSAKPADTPLRVREHPALGVYVEGLAEVLVAEKEQMLELLHKGNEGRRMGATKVNDTSSRSHAVLTIHLVQRRKWRGAGGAAQTTELRAKINLVDLAGSERARSTGAEGTTLKEGAKINRSLTMLGLVISALADAGRGGRKPKHIPYRDSTLTFILKESLGGNSKTLMLSTVSSATLHHNETLSTLRYADRAKAIVTRAFVNESAGDKRVRELEEEVERLRAQIRLLLERSHQKEVGAGEPSRDAVTSTAQVAPVISRDESTGALSCPEATSPSSDDYPAGSPVSGGWGHGSPNDSRDAEVTEGSFSEVTAALERAELLIEQLTATGEKRQGGMSKQAADYAGPSTLRLSRRDPYLLNVDGAGDWLIKHLATDVLYIKGAANDGSWTSASSCVDQVPCEVAGSPAAATTSAHSSGSSSCLHDNAGADTICVPSDVMDEAGRTYCTIRREASSKFFLCPEPNADVFYLDALAPLSGTAELHNGDVFYLADAGLSLKYVVPGAPPVASARSRRKQSSPSPDLPSSAAHVSAASPSSSASLSQHNNIVQRPSLPSPYPDGESTSHVSAVEASNSLTRPVDVPALSLKLSALDSATHGLVSSSDNAQNTNGSELAPRGSAKPIHIRHTPPLPEQQDVPLNELRYFVGKRSFVFLGPTGSGKSYVRENLARPDKWYNFIFKEPFSSSPTTGVLHSSLAVSGPEVVRLDLFELGGAPQYSILLETLPARRVTYVLCFSLAGEVSLEVLRGTLEAILSRTACNDAAILLLGTYMDRSERSPAELNAMMADLEVQVHNFFLMLQPRPELHPRIVGRFVVDNVSRKVLSPSFRAVTSFSELLAWLGDHALSCCQHDVDFAHGCIPARCMELKKCVEAECARPGCWCIPLSDYKRLSCERADWRYSTRLRDLHVHTELLESWGVLQHRFRHVVLRHCVVLDVPLLQRMLAAVLHCCCCGGRTSALADSKGSRSTADGAPSLASGVRRPPVSQETNSDGVVSVARLHRALSQHASYPSCDEDYKKVFMFLKESDYIILGSQLRCSPDDAQGSVANSHGRSEALDATRPSYREEQVPGSSTVDWDAESFVVLPMCFRTPSSEAVTVRLTSILSGPFYRFTLNVVPLYFLARIVCRLASTAGDVYLGPVARIDLDRVTSSGAQRGDSGTSVKDDRACGRCLFWSDAAWLVGPGGHRCFLRLVHHSLFLAFYQPSGGGDGEFFGRTLEAVRRVAEESPGSTCAEGLLCAYERDPDEGTTACDEYNGVAGGYYHTVEEDINSLAKVQERELFALRTARLHAAGRNDISYSSTEDVIPWTRRPEASDARQRLLQAVATHNSFSHAAQQSVESAANALADALADGGADRMSEQGDALDRLVDALARA